MKQDDRWWIDSNGNKWTKFAYTEAQAKKYSDSLTMCEQCINCRDCVNCIGLTEVNGAKNLDWSHTR